MYLKCNTVVPEIEYLLPKVIQLLLRAGWEESELKYRPQVSVSLF